VTERPVVVSSRDVLVGGGDEAPERPPADRRRRLAGLALAAGCGFAAAQLVPAAAPDGATGASLALVTGRQPHLEVTADDPPLTGMEVVLVNTGSRALRLDGATVDGTALRWDVDRPLEPGRQAAALLRDEQPCDGPLDALSGPGPAREVRVSTRDDATRERLPDVLVALPTTAGRLYDMHVRQSCGLPPLPEALELVTTAAELAGQDLVTSVGLQSRSVRDVQVVGVAADVPGLTTRLTAADGQPTALPLTVPGRTRKELAEGFLLDVPDSSPYRLRTTTTADGCAALRERSGVENVVVHLVDPGDPEVVAVRPVAIDLTPLLERVCPPAGAPPG
jgi:hypothetical protein